VDVDRVFSTMGPSDNRTQKIINLGARAIRHPGWLAEDVRGRVRRRGGWQFSLAPYAEYLADARTTICDALEVGGAEYDEAILSDWWPEHPDDHQAGRTAMSTIMRAITRLTQPAVSVETGVARGVTTATTLQAMEDNKAGHLYSVDLPPLSAPAGYVGQLVPERLHHRWTLRPGPSRQILPPLLKELGVIDVFLHDAEHSYASQTEEFIAAWPHLRSGGLLLADDVRNTAFMDFAHYVEARPFLIGTPKDIDGVGLLRKES
jgi:predicted O-methyltransferase YrrM